jgi:hypothetical protein
MFAALLIAVLCVEHRQVAGSSPVDVSAMEPPPHDSFESVLQRAAGTADHSAQWTELALSNSTSTDGAMPTR